MCLPFVIYFIKFHYINYPVRICRRIMAVLSPAAPDYSRKTHYRAMQYRCRTVARWITLYSVIDSNTVKHIYRTPGDATSTIDICTVSVLGHPWLSIATRRADMFWLVFWAVALLLQWRKVHIVIISCMYITCSLIINQIYFKQRIYML